MKKTDFSKLQISNEKDRTYTKPCVLSVITAKADEAVFIMMFYQQNIDILHGNFITLDEWKEVLSKDDEDEENFLIRKGAAPVAWLRINGLLNKDTAWISMLAVSDTHHKQGIGSFAVKFAEELVGKRGFSKLSIRTTDDNIPAKNLYEKCGYLITGHGEYTTGDGIKRMGCTFIKEL